MTPFSIFHQTHDTTLSDALGIPPPRVLELLTALEFLYDRVRSWGSAEGIHGFLRITGLDALLEKDDQAHTYARIVSLLQPNPELERQRKLKWLQTGILETAIGFRSFVDLRPNFTSDRSEITEFVPTVILHIATDTSDDGKVLQLTEESVRKMKEVVEDIEKKLATLRQDDSVKARVYRATGGKEKS